MNLVLFCSCYALQNNLVMYSIYAFNTAVWLNIFCTVAISTHRFDTTVLRIQVCIDTCLERCIFLHFDRFSGKQLLKKGDRNTWEWLKNASPVALGLKAKIIAVSYTCKPILLLHNAVMGCFCVICITRQLATTQEKSHVQRKACLKFSDYNELHHTSGNIFIACQ